MAGFQHPNLSGIPSEWVPVTAGDDADNTGTFCIGLYIQHAGTVAVQFSGGATRTIPVPAGFLLPGHVTRVLATGTESGVGSVFALQG